jgi:hypothetical protein
VHLQAQEQLWQLQQPRYWLLSSQPPLAQELQLALLLSLQLHQHLL